jgi:hypothetical protein
MDRLGLPVSSFQELARTKAHCLLYQLIRTDFRMLLLAWLGLAWLGFVVTLIWTPTARRRVDPAAFYTSKHVICEGRNAEKHSLSLSRM